MGKFQHGLQGGGGVRPQSSTPSTRSGGLGGRDRSPPDDTVAKHWPGYLHGGYFDDKGNLKVEYVARCLPGDEKLPDLQQHGVEPLIRAMAKARPPRDGLTRHQIRRYFNHCRAVETKTKSGATWERIRSEFQRMAAAAADAKGKRDQKIPDLFENFIRRNVDAVKTQKDFLHGFLPHFEALVGFGSLHLSSERN